ncbi:UNKNOWN [Stylonychia lemnae]|uniref:Uncharacterized protein n=1 Tax=Stylonychia lemnae TaxID=5949 RepID=A0A078AA48_STYLE|nr:UNKNOWN [Stylonychia lemnae]|eukprot:CDW79150.1 UNKNOWN [Stylonychia lemnae]
MLENPASRLVSQKKRINPFTFEIMKQTKQRTRQKNRKKIGGPIQNTKLELSQPRQSNLLLYGGYELLESNQNICQRAFDVFIGSNVITQNNALKNVYISQVLKPIPPQIPTEIAVATVSPMILILLMSHPSI